MYPPPEALTFLRALVLNQECKVALKGNFVTKRDDSAVKNQGMALCALGEIILDFLRPTTQESQSWESLNLGVAKINDGTKILVDFFYRLSLIRRSQITPALPVLNLTAKTAEAIPTDDFLFDVSFGDEMKKATAMEKSSKDIVKAPLIISRRVQQSVKQSALVTSARSGNAPVRNSRSVTKTGAMSDNHSIYRHWFRLRIGNDR